MRTCPRCGRAFAEVVGAPEQVCPHCGFVTTGHASAPVPGPGPTPVDPVGAAKVALQVFVRSYPALSLAWLPAVVANFAAAFAVLAYARARGISFDTNALGDDLRILGVGIPAYAAAFVVELACWSLVARVVLGAPARRPLPWTAMLATGALLTIAFAIGLALVVVPFLVFFHWFMYAPAAVAEGQPTSKAFESSRAFARDRRTAGFTALVLLVAAGAFAIDTYLLAPAFTSALHPLGDVGDALAEALAGWVLGPLVPVFPAAYWALARQAAPALASSPVSASARSTTACPQCGTLIPYVPTGAPVDVVCPECGHNGRVL